MNKPKLSAMPERGSIQSVTSVGQNPEAERKTRMIKYTVSMTIRVICLILGMVVTGWLQWLFFAGAIFLPYIAVVIANDVKHDAETKATVVAATPLRIEASAFTVIQEDPEAKGEHAD